MSAAWSDQKFSKTIEVHGLLSGCLKNVGYIINSMTNSNSDASAGGEFTTTRWSLIVVAREGNADEARQALAELCRSYWYPIYAYIRRRGYLAYQAGDLTQEFFSFWLEHDLLSSVVPEKGRFRSFLLAACKNFLANQRSRERALRRGGGRWLVSLDLRDAEGRYLREPASDSLTPERLFERRWALSLLENVLGRLAAEMEQTGKKPLFDRLAVALQATGKSAPYVRIAAELGTTENAVKVAAHRLRARYRALLIEEVTSTVEGQLEVEAEIRDLLAAVAR
jgi:DNA-directed RNA polymerase specialized sigma24 family protein